MLKTYLKTALRNVGKYKRNTAINIAGLVVGFTAFLLIFLVIRYEESFDDFHANKDQIYRLVRIGRQSENREYRTGVPFPVAAALRNDLPQLKNVAAIMGDNDVQVLVTAADGSVLKKFKEPQVFIAEPQYTNMFSFPFIAGNKTTALKDANSVVLSRDIANKYFGDWHKAINGSLKLYGEAMKVTGILENAPANTDFPLGIVVSYATLMNARDQADWGSINDDNYCFVQLNSNASPEQVARLVDGFTDKRIKPVNPGYFLGLQPLNEIHFDERYGSFSGATFSKDLLLALRMIGLFLLVIACVNFINITTAHAINRAKEVGVRKVLGSSRAQLVLQFLCETGIITFLSLASSVVVCFGCLPTVNRLLNIHITSRLLFSQSFPVFMLAAFAIVTLLSGFYPALVLSRFKSISVLKGITVVGNTGVSLRRSLVVFQFVIAQVLIIGTLVIASQMDYFRNADMGFTKEGILNVSFPRDSLSRTKMDFLNNEIARVKGVTEVSLSVYTPATGGGGWATDLQEQSGTNREEGMIVQMKPADTAFFHLYDLKLVAGRAYFPSDTVREFVVNESVVRNMNIPEPAKAIGKMIRVSGITAPIVGVVKDYHIFSLRDAISPTVMTTMKPRYGMANIKIEVRNTAPVIQSLQSIWSKYYPDYVFEYNFLDQSIAHYYQQEGQLSTLYKLFSSIAIFISCLGLYGLISFMAVQRRKEIGIRKVLGAPVRDMVVMLAKEFTVLVSVAFLIASPVAWYIMHQWLQHYTYRISIGVLFFIITIAGSLLITWITVSYTAVKAALANPVKSLRTE